MNNARALPQDCPAVSDLLPELDTVHARLLEAAASHGLHLLRGLPTGQTLVHSAGPDVMSAEDFCALAARANAQFLYVAAERFDAVRFGSDEDLLEMMDRGDRSRLAALLKRAAAEHGRCQELGMSFVAGGVVHMWRADAAWFEELGDELADLEEKYEEDPKTAPQDAPSTPAEVDRLAGLVQAVPAFREAATNAQRERIMLREHPQLRSCQFTGLSRLGYDVLNEAALRVAESAKQAYADFEARLPDLSQEIVAAGVLDQATNAPARKAVIRTYLLEHSGGYPPSKDFVELVHGQPGLKKPQRSTSPTTPPDLWDGAGTL